MKLELQNLAKSATNLARNSRIHVLEMTHSSKASHIGSCLSVIDILAAAFTYKTNFSEINKVQILLSKGHAAGALYAVLAELTLLESDLTDYCLDDSKLYGHVNHLASEAIPLSTGSLGHGMPFALGMALASKLKLDGNRVIAVISDGECNEGTTWESALIANQFKLDNFIVIIDRNRIQSLGPTEDTIQLEPLGDKWSSFGWRIVNVDGHNCLDVLTALTTDSAGPLCIIASTIKGKGVSYMENAVEWHYKSPNENELAIAKEEVLGS